MSAIVIDGRAVAKERQKQLQGRVAELIAAGKRPPGLAAVLIGDDPGSQIYVSKKEQAAAKVGIRGKVLRLSAATTQAEAEAVVDALNADPMVDGILVQLPLPKHLDEKAILEKIDPRKDVDGLTARSHGCLALNEPGFVPCTPKGIMTLLRSIDYELKGKVAAVVGRSRLVGAPIARLLMHSHATVIQVHSRTVRPWELTNLADVLVVAAGIHNLVDAKWVKPGAVVVDVGIHRIDDRIAGDVNFVSVSPVAGYITPVPGGVGPMTITSLLENTLQARQISR